MATKPPTRYGMFSWDSHGIMMDISSGKLLQFAFYPLVNFRRSIGYVTLPEGIHLEIFRSHGGTRKSSESWTMTWY